VEVSELPVALEENVIESPSARTPAV
jgi:hypothetical protein